MIGSEFARVYLPDVSALRAGDIILTRHREGAAGAVKSSTAIAQVTGGSFSHALICTSPPTLIEALPDGGVVTVSLGRSFAHDRASVRVLRYRNADVAADAASHAQLELGRGYSMAKALLSVSAVDAPASDRGVFCSALVAQAFSDAGAPEFKAVPPHRTTPATLERLEGLHDVTDQVFREAAAPRNLETLVALDGDRGASPSSRQSAISAAYSKRLIPLVEAIQRDFPRTPRRRVATLNDCIQFLLNAYDVQDEGSIDAVPLRGRLEILDAATANLVGSGELTRLYDELAELDRVMFEAARLESFKSDPDIDAIALRQQYEASQAELPRRIAALTGFEAEAHRSRTAAAWLAIQRRVNTAVGERNRLIEEILARVEGSNS